MDAHSRMAATIALPLHERCDAGLLREPVSRYSVWGDPAWFFDDPTPGASRIMLTWAVPLGDGSTLTAFQHAATLDWGRRLVWSLVHAPGDGAGALKPGSMAIVMTGLRTLLPWMLGQGLRLPSDLGPPALRDYLADLPGLIAGGLGADAAVEEGDYDENTFGTSVAYLRIRVVLQLWQQRPALARSGIAPMPEIPWSGRSTIALARELATKVEGQILPIPDEVAIPLLNAAARLVGLPADDVIRLHEASRAAYEGHRGRWGHGAARGTRKLAARTAAECFAFATLPGEDAPWHAPITRESNRGRLSNGSLQTLRYLVEAIREAAWTVVQATTGMRISEICALEAGTDPETGLPSCVEVSLSASGLHDLFLVRSRLSKTEASPREVTWLLGMRSRGSADIPLPVRAIAILDRLLAPYREMTGSRSLVLGFAGPLGLPRLASTVSEPLSANLRHSLKVFVERWVDLSHLSDTSARSPIPGDLVSWRETAGRCISPHRWRSTFAHFVFATDSRLLPALAMQFHHISLAMTEEGYLGLNREMIETFDSVRLQETARYLHELATGRPLAGRMGEHLVAQADALRAVVAGLPPTAAWLRLVRLVEESGLRLWFAPHANCLPLAARDMRCHGVAGTWPGLAREPNRAAQEPSVCAGCSCAVMDERHMPFWKARFSRNLLAWRAADQAGHGAEFAVVRARAVQSRAILSRFGLDVLAFEVALEAGSAA